MKGIIFKNECSSCTARKENSTTNSNSQIMKFVEDLLNPT